MTFTQALTLGKPVGRKAWGIFQSAITVNASGKIVREPPFYMRDAGDLGITFIDIVADDWGEYDPKSGRVHP